MYKSIMHVAFFVNNIEKTKDFYVNKLGAKIKMAVKYKAYINRPDSDYYKKAQTNPEDYCIIYFEVAENQFVEVYPKEDGQLAHTEFNNNIGYSHFSLLVEDIHAARDDFANKGIEILVEPKIGNSHTWQMWIADPDDNRIEVMQFTEESFQLVGHID